MQPILQMREVEFRVGKVTGLGGGKATSESQPRLNFLPPAAFPCSRVSSSLLRHPLQTDVL